MESSPETIRVIREPRAPPSDGSVTFSPRSREFNPPPAPTRRRRLPLPQLGPDVESYAFLDSLRMVRAPGEAQDAFSTSSDDDERTNDVEASDDVIRRVASFSRRNAVVDQRARRSSRVPTNLEQFLRRLNDEELANEFQAWMLETRDRTPPPVPPPPPPPQASRRRTLYDFMKKSFCLVGTLVVGVVFVLFGVVFVANSVVLENDVKNAYVIAGTALVGTGALIMILYTAWHCYQKVIKIRMRERRRSQYAHARTDVTSETGVGSDELISCTFASGEPPDIDFNPVVELYSHRGSSVWAGSSFSTLPPPYVDMEVTSSDRQLRLMNSSNPMPYSDGTSFQGGPDTRSRSSSLSKWRQRAATESRIHRSRIIQSRLSLTPSTRRLSKYKTLER
uniref:uncharacterized protein LOC100184806 n=1 Tax=Ciona intestinalis TaxID=7719 RepID=UPI000180D32B|nr:uncharacterized protein LOC100184806 [Ciona intestinalis]|eukprot:XP_002125545.1 uncharacterized protein LOC100184806 [Ciona intestinalis]